MGNRDEVTNVVYESPLLLSERLFIPNPGVEILWLMWWWFAMSTQLTVLKQQRN